MKPVKQPEWPIHDVLMQRWSPRSFADCAVEPEKLNALFEAARWSASSHNEQPWRFFVAERQETTAYAILAGCLNAKNRLWAAHAPVLMLAVAKLTFTHSQKNNRHACHDVGQAMAGIVFQAGALGLHVRQIAGFDHEQAARVFDLPAGYEALTMAAIGYLGTPQDLAEQFREQETAAQTRRPFGDIVLRGQRRLID